jgi:hypothetical protein
MSVRRAILLEESSEKHFQKAFKQHYTAFTYAVGRGTSTASKIVGILELLGDGQWHSVEEIRQKIDLNVKELRQITSFLKEYNFVVSDETEKAVKIEENARRFLTHTANS